MRTLRGLAILGLLLPAVAEAAGPVEFTAGEGGPEALSRMGDPARVLAVAVHVDGERLAAAFPAGEEDRQSRVVLSPENAGDPSDWILNGRVVALRFSRDGKALVVLAERLGRKGRRSASLNWIETEDPGRRPRSLVLPSTARGLDVSREDGTVAVASGGDVRTFEGGSLRSGRVYALAGENLAVSFVPGGSRILVGRPDGIWRVDLSAPQSREGMPVEATAASERALVDLIVSPRGDRALARTETDEVLEIIVEPLAIRSTGRTAAALAWPGEEEPRPFRPAPPPQPPIPPPAPPEPPSDPAPEPVPEVSAPSPDPEPAPLPDGQLAGRLTGPARESAVAVRLLGPDNVLREARRVAVGSDGTWAADGLAPGTYRVMAEGKPGTVLECTPPFRTVRVGDGGRVEVEPIDVQAVVR